MLRVLTMLVYFLKELIFDSKEEYDYTSHAFNVRKVLVFILLSVSFLSNAIFMTRIYNLAVQNTQNRKDMAALNKRIEELIVNQKEKDDELKRLASRNKKQAQPSSDRGRAKIKQEDTEPR